MNKREITFREKLFSKFGNEYKLIGEYINSHTKTEFYHDSCGKEFSCIPHNILNNGVKCTKCGIKKQRTFNELYNEIIEKTNGEYELISSHEELLAKNSNSYINMNKKGIIRHYDGNGYHDFSIKVTKFVNDGLRCTECKNNKKLSNLEYQEKINSIYGKNVFKLIGNYNGRKKEVVLEHNCGVRTKDLSYNFTTNKRHCSYCSMSSGEKFINDFLLEKNIPFEYNYKNHTCKDISILRFDFYINSMNLMLEFDGIQHFEKVKIFSEGSLLDRQTKDMIKNKFCIDNKINILRISYKSYKDLRSILESLCSSTTIEKLNTFNDICYISSGNILIKNGIYNSIKII